MNDRAHLLLAGDDLLDLAPQVGRERGRQIQAIRRTGPPVCVVGNVEHNSSFGAVDRIDQNRRTAADKDEAVVAFWQSRRGHAIGENSGDASAVGAYSRKTANRRWRAVGRDQQLASIPRYRLPAGHLHGDVRGFALIDIRDARILNHLYQWQSLDGLREALPDQAMFEGEPRRAMGGNDIVREFDPFRAPPVGDAEAVHGHRRLTHEQLQHAQFGKPLDARRMQKFTGQSPVVVQARLDHQRVVAQLLQRHRRDRARNAAAPDDHIDVDYLVHRRPAVPSAKWREACGPVASLSFAEPEHSAPRILVFENLVISERMMVHTVANSRMADWRT